MSEEQPCHQPTLVRIGPGEILLGAYYQFTPDQLQDLTLIPLNSQWQWTSVFPQQGPHKISVYWLPMEDMKGVPHNWVTHVSVIADRLSRGERFAAWCAGGHGRTGTLAASLIAILEPHVSDPIEEIRNRYCEKAVETIAQSKAIFNLKGLELPTEWFKKPMKSIIRQEIWDVSHQVTPELFDGYDIPSYVIEQSLASWIPGYLAWWHGKIQEREDKDRIERAKLSRGSDNE